MSSETARLSSKSILFNFCIALLSGITVGLIFHRIANRFFYEWIPQPATIVGAMIILVTGIAAGIKLSFSVNNRSVIKLRELADTILCYAVALDLSLFGFQKIFGMQFVVPLAMLDEPFNNLSSDSLTWAYFGHSYPYTLCIAFGQIAGALLLAIKRTRFLGTIVLIPILINTVLIDYFYSLPLPVLVHATFLLLTCCYFGSQNIMLLKGIFFDSDRKRNWIAIAISLLVIPLLLAISAKEKPSMYGKFGATNQNADSLNRQKFIPPTTVYFDYDNELVFDFNDYRHRYYGTYSLKGDSISIRWHYPPGSPTWSGLLLFRDGDPENLKGFLGDNTIDVRLSRQR